MKIVVIRKRADARMPAASWLMIPFAKSTANRLSACAAAG
jgi:hypothetical protein